MVNGGGASFFKLTWGKKERCGEFGDSVGV